MREIEFRFWNKEKKVMCYDNEDKSANYWDGVCCSDIALVNSILKNPDEYEVMQYTGLKDKNKTKIFDGDIIKHKTNETLNGKPIYIYYCINYCETEKCLRAFKNGLTGYAYQISFASYIIKEQDLEVVGNIYEHPEFLTHQHEDKGE